MARKILIKVCGMREPDNTLAIARLKPDYLGFIFVPGSPRYVEPSLRDGLIRSIPVETRTVGVFRDAELDEVIDIARRFNFAAIQLHGGEDSEYITRFKDRMPSCHVFKAVLLGSGAHELDSLPQGADLYVFDGAHPGSGEGFDWGVLKDYRGETPFFLAGGVGVHSVEQVHRCAQVHRQCLGIDLNSKVETRAGVKDLAAVRQVIEGVRR